MNRKCKELTDLLPTGYKLRDTGAPRGERNFWLILDPDGKTEASSFSLISLIDYAKRRLCK